MRRNMSKVISVVLTMSLALTVCACSAKSSADTENTTAEAETEIEKEEETEKETADSSGNDPSGNDVSDNDVSENDAEEETKDGTKSETEASPESKPNATSESEEEESPEEESTNSKTSEKDSTKSETTTSETTTEAVTVQSVSAVVNGTHYVGETLTGADFTVTVTMSDGETLTNPAGWSAQPLTLNSTSNLITVAYEGASVTITVEASVQTASNSGSSTSGSTGSTSGTTAGSTTSSTTSATTSTTQSSTTSTTTNTTAATTATTTAAETEVASPICGDREWSYVFAQALFEAQNELRTEAGLDPFIWDDSLYEVAKQCAKVCGDAGTIDHDLTAQYREWILKTTSDGRTLQVYYGENLQHNGATIYKGEDPSSYMDEARIYLAGIKRSSGHYAWVISSAMKYSAVAAYNVEDSVNGGFYVSYIFYEGDEVYNQGEYYDPETDQWYYP